jgi:hypothetical protein
MTQMEAAAVLQAAFDAGGLGHQFSARLAHPRPAWQR